MKGRRKLCKYASLKQQQQVSDSAKKVTHLPAHIPLVANVRTIIDSSEMICLSIEPQIGVRVRSVGGLLYLCIPVHSNASYWRMLLEKGQHCIG